MEKLNKNENYIIEFYNRTNEDERFNSKAIKVEFLTTMKYIHTNLKRKMKILEIGAGTGAYSIPLAKEGYDVTAIELVEKKLNILKDKSQNLSNLHAFQGNALNLSNFENHSFDMVLVLGPMYHLFTKNEQIKAILEAIRVCKKGGFLMFAYLTHSTIVWDYGIIHQNISLMTKTLLDKTGRIKSVPKEIFNSFFVEDFNKLFKKTRTRFIKNVALDSVAYSLGKEFIEKLDEEQYQNYINWHYNTCERLDQLGLSSHILYICKKI